MKNPNIEHHSTPLDPNILRFRNAIQDGYARFGNLENLSLTERRKIAEAVRAPWAEGGPEMAAIDEYTIGASNVHIRVYRPSLAQTLPVLLYLHGGGWTLFSLNTHDRLMREYAARSKVAVIGVDYSLSPEVRYPVAIEEIVDVITALRDSDAVAGIDANRMVVGGDSAGANLTVAANLLMKDRQFSPCQGMLLNYGVYDSTPTSSYQRYDGPDYLLNAEEMTIFWNNYIGNQTPQETPYAKPLHSDLSLLPSTFMTIADGDILYSENMAMAELLAAAQVPVTATVYPGTTHSFLEAVAIADVSCQALDDAAVWLQKILLVSALDRLKEDGMGSDL